ncbi:proton-coupled folate transporter [Trichonephila inaurata madagascariensis]|uniref:Proton-coupled folate transporter n=1 Tax=Trichonephila inaurata madagascariensis TaxID=2747483 RepID=A0A8X7C649_9ARAC|nr:proton-coupled folate transporter [Trichonephila inaurata madagascariensis]
MPSTVSEFVTSSNYLYQGDTNDPPVPPHFKSKVPEEDSEIPPTQKLKSKLLCFGRIFEKLKLEIVAFLFTFSCVLTRISSTSMILNKVCLAHFNYPPEICANLENHTEIKISVERLSTNYQLGHTLIQTVPAALLSCFVGPWSDHYGRKLPVIVAILGMSVDTLGSAICAHYLDSRVEYYFIPAIFTGAFGGVVSLLAVVYSYASDLTPLRERTMKYAFIEMAAGFAQPLGVASGGWIYNFFGYPSVFLLSTCGLVASFIWVIFLLPETRGQNNKDSFGTKIRKLFTCKTFRESFIATAKQRPHQGRKQIVLLIISMCFLVIATNSTSDINYLYVHHQFNWGTTEYSTITAIYSVFAVFLLIIVVPLFKYFKSGDPTLGLVGTTSIILKFLGIGLAWKTVIFHIANLLGLLSACASLAARSRISKVVSSDDLGKVFSFVATAESLLPVLTTILISQIFNVFLNIYPGMQYIVLAICLILPFSVFTWMTCLPAMTSTEGNLNDERDRDSYTSIDA